MDSATSKAALSALFQRLFDTLALPFFQKLGFLFDVEKEAKKLKSTLSRIEALLSDAEERQIKEKSVRLWLSELKHIAYDAEDILDELAYIELQSKIEAALIQTRKRKLTDQVPDFFSRLGSNFNLGYRIKELRERLDEIVTENNHLHLRVIRHGPETERLRMRPPTSSFVDESIVFGREADKAKVVRLLTSDDSSASDSSIHEVVPICGMGGLGKTTLAQLAYNDEHVVEHFEVRSWVYVSQDFDLIKLTKAIAESVLGRKSDLTNLDAIQVSIKEALKEKRFLLVLDDVWTEDFDDWHKLRAPLMFGARGSRILVTTRSQRVSSNMGTVPTHFLQGLSDDDCWSLFERRAFVDGDSDAHPDLVKIGKKIVNKCKGLPLAVKTLGGLLRFQVDCVEWEAILKSEIWDLPEERNDILPALRLSYHHLPSHLKRCFTFCACVVDKGQLGITGNGLVIKWMAQGFIQPKGSTSEQVEDIGREYLADLVSRSLLNCEERYGIVHYRMHDLTHDLARSVLGADFWKIGDEKSHGNAEKARYMSDSLLKSCSNFEDFYCLKSLRTLSLSYTGNIPADLFKNLRHIRTLHLCGTGITEFPESIGDLLQLRYLELSSSNIERLPKSVTRLYNLQTLKCLKLEELPSDLSNLVNLRHLFCNALRVSTPPRIGTLKSLQMLMFFNVGKEIGRGINELKDMIHLRGYLRISQLEHVVNVEEAKEAQLKNKQKIDRLGLRWKCGSMESRQEVIEEEVLNALQPHTNLKRLHIEGYCGVRFPTWLEDSSFSKLVSVNLFRCRCRLLPPFGRLPSLKHLSLVDLYELKKIGREFYGDGTMAGFPPLESLIFRSMPDLEELSGLESDIRHICAICINSCSKLRALPRVSTIRLLTLSACDEQSLSSLRHLTSLSSLKISNCSNLTSLGNGLQHLTSLQSLEIAYCPELTSLNEVDLPATLDDGLGNSNYSNPTCLPKGLQKLTISGCPKIHSLPEELPTTLSYLKISYCSNITSLPNGLQHLTSLQYLEISDCPELTFLTDVDLPATLDDGLGNSNYSNPTCLPKGLQKLILKDCPKISSLPEELLTTLRYLYIEKCPLLEEKYLVLAEEGDEYRCKISDIPNITFEGYYSKGLVWYSWIFN